MAKVSCNRSQLQQHRSMAPIRINDREFPYTFGLRSMMYYEHMTGKAYGSDNSVTASAAVHYACLLGANPSCSLSFAEFVGEIDKGGKALLDDLNAALNAELERWNSINAQSDEEAPSKKKKR